MPNDAVACVTQGSSIVQEEGSEGLKRPRTFYGWWIVAAGMGVTWLAAFFFHYGFSAFFIPWRDSFGWSRALLGGVIGVTRVQGGLVAPLSGWLIDKHGPRRLMLLGLGMMGLGFIALSRVNSLVMLYVVFMGLLAIGSSLGTYRPVQVAVANWFIRRRGMAFGLVQVGSGLGGSAVFLFAVIINAYGWRVGAVFAGLLVWAVGLPLASLVRHKPEHMGLLPDGDRVSSEIGVVSETGVGGSTYRQRESSGGETRLPPSSRAHRFFMRDPRPEIDLTLWQALRSQAFWMMTITYAMWTAMPSIVTVHIAPFLAEELDLEYVVALSALSFFAFASIFGRVGFGFLADYLNIRLLIALLLIMQGLGIFLFSQVHTLAQVPMYVIVFAVPYGGTIPLRGVLQGYFFGRKSFGTIGGFLQLVDLPAAVAAPIWIGWMADVLPGGYRLGFQIIAVTLVIAAVSILLARRPRPPLPDDRPPMLIQAFRRR